MGGSEGGVVGVAVGDEVIEEVLFFLGELYDLRVLLLKIL